MKFQERLFSTITHQLYHSYDRFRLGLDNNSDLHNCRNPRKVGNQIVRNTSSVIHQFKSLINPPVSFRTLQPPGPDTALTVVVFPLTGWSSVRPELTLLNMMVFIANSGEEELKLCTNCSWPGAFLMNGASAEMGRMALYLMFLEREGCWFRFPHERAHAFTNTWDSPFLHSI